MGDLLGILITEETFFFETSLVTENRSLTLVDGVGLFCDWLTQVIADILNRYSNERSSL